MEFRQFHSNYYKRGEKLELKFHGVFIYWGLLNSDGDDIYELVGVFDKQEDAEQVKDVVTKELESEGHSFSHGIIISFENNVNLRGNFKA